MSSTVGERTNPQIGNVENDYGENEHLRHPRKAVKVVQLTSIHSPLDVRIFHKHSKTLSRAGYDVVIVAPKLRVTGDTEEPRSGVRIQTVPRATTRFERLRRTIADVYRCAIEQNGDIYHFHDPELIPVGLLLKLQGKRVIYDVHENLPLQVLTKPWISPPYRRAIGLCAGYLESLASASFDGIIAATQEIADRFPPQKTITVQNFPDFAPKQGVPYGDREPLVIYIGAVSRIRGIAEMIAAIQQVPTALGARLAIAGPFDSPELESELRSISLPQVDLLGFQTQLPVNQLLGRARIGLVLLHPTPSYLNAQPMKLFEYMRAGIPSIVSDFPSWRKIVEDTECGLLVNPLDPKAIAEAISWLLRNPREAEEMGRRAREASIARFNWRSERDKLLQLYGALAA